MSHRLLTQCAFRVKSSTVERSDNEKTFGLRQISCVNLVRVTRVSAVKFGPRCFKFFGQFEANPLKHLKASMPCL